MNNIQKCAVIGCGNVGATCAYSLMQSGMFAELVLIDLNRQKAQGEAADLNHGLPFLSPMEIYAGDYSDLADAALIIITAGVNQKPGETRLDLVHANAKVFGSIVSQITRYNDSAILLVVTNPVDILSYVTQKISGFPAHRVIGSGTVLDTARLKYLVGRHFGVDSRNVHSFIIGEHGDSELAVWSSANISGIDLDRYCASRGEMFDRSALEPLFEETKNSAYRIIEAKGATYYAIAESIKRIVSAIVRDENSILPVSTLLDGQYGLSGIYMGLPCVIGRDGIKRVLEIPLDESERARLEVSAASLREVIDSLEYDLSPV